MVNSAAYLGKKGLSQAVKSDFAKKKIKNLANKYLDEALDSFTSDLSNRISGQGFFYPGTIIPDFNSQNAKLMRKYVNALKGGNVDIHKAILKVAPKKGFVLPGHNYTGAGNPLENQVKWDPNTGQILEIYHQPTGKTGAIAMQHDVDYSICGNKPKNDQIKCKNKADKKMVESLDAIPYNERQWGHFLARNAINTKQKLGLGIPKNGKSLRVKK